MDTIDRIRQELNHLANEKSKKIYFKQNIQEEVLGVNMGPLRKIARAIKANNPLAWELWASNVYELRIVATAVLEADLLTEDQLLKLIQTTETTYLIDEIAFTLVAKRNDLQALMDRWFEHDDDRVYRSAWNLAIVLNKAKQLTMDQRQDLLDIVEKDLFNEEAKTQYTMNRLLCEIGIQEDALTHRCVQIGESLGLYKDVKVAKGCVSPYAPAWIEAGRRNRKD
jgi:3-methyladenine DNA glycosylase AlkD